MAKPADITQEQEARLRSTLGLAPDADLTNLYERMSEDGIRKLSGAAIPTAIPTAAPTAAPVTTEAEARRRSDYRTQVQPQSGMLPRFPPSAATSGQEQLDKALEQRRRDVAARSFTGPAETRLTPEQGAAEIARGQAIATAPRTPAGERRALTPEPSTIRNISFRSVFGDNVVSDFFEAVSPQVIETTEQKRERDRQAYKATQDFFKSFSPNKPPSREEFKKVYDSYRFYGGKDPEGFMASIMKRSGLDEAARAAFTSVSPTGQVIESPLTTAGKVLSASEAVLSAGAATAGRAIGREVARAKGLPEKALPKVSFREEFKTDVAKGTGLMGAGSESFSKAAEYAGADKDTQDLLGYVGGTLGFIGGIGIPLDLGVVQGATTAARTAATAADIAGEFGTGVGRAAARGAAGGFTEGAIDAWRISGQRTGGLKTVTKEMEDSTRRWLSSPEVSNVSSTTIKLAADDGVQAAIVADREAGKVAVETKTPYDQTPYINTLRQRFDDVQAAEFAAGTNHPITRYNTFDEWVEAAEKKGIDVYNSAGKRTEVLGNPPPNVRIKEVEDSVKTTRAGRSSVDYFDDVATGGRSNLYYDAFIDTLDPALRSRLVAGGSVKSEEFLAAVDDYVNTIRVRGKSAGKTAAQIDAEIGAVEAALKGRGIKLAAGRVSGAAKGVTPTMKGGLISTPDIERALEKAYAIDLGRRTLNDFASRTGITGQGVKVGNIVLSPTEAKQVTEKVKNNKTLSAIRERLKKNNGNPVEVSPAELEELKDYFITPFTKDAAATGNLLSNATDLPPSLFIRPTETYSPFQAAPAIRRIQASVGGPKPRAYIVSANQYNDLVKAALALEASPKITAKSTEQIGKIAGTLAGAGDKASELSYFVRNVLTPKDLQESGLAAILIDKSKKVLNPPPTKNPVANKVITEVNDRMGALGERFKAKMRRKINVDKVERPRAFADTMVEEFTTEGIYKPPTSTGVTKPFETAPTGAPLTRADTAFKQKMGAYEMYRSYVASIYGGYEQAIDAVATTGRTLEMDKMAIATKEMRDLVTVLMHAEETIFNNTFIAFKAAVAAGENVAALNILQRLHVELSGYSIQQALTRLSGVSEDAIPKLLKDATEAANDGVIKYVPDTDRRVVSDGNYVGNNIPFLSEKGSRGIDEAYKAASQQAPLFKPENFKEMLIGNYYLRAQANAVDDVLFKAQVDFPELFPNASLLLEVADGDWSTVRSALVRTLDEQYAAGILSPTQAAVYPQLRQSIISTGNARVPIFSTPAVRNPRTAKLSQDLLISGIEDNVSLVSGGGGRTRRYLDTLSENFGTGFANATDKTAVRQVLQKGLDELESPPASLYGAIFDSQARADATALFYQTSLTNIKNQLKSPFAASVQGVAEKVGTIPLLQQAQASLKKPLFNAVNIKRTTETIQALQMSTAATKLDQMVAKDGAKLADEITNLERNIGTIIDGEISPELIALAKKKEEVLNDLGKQVGDVQARRVITDVVGTVYDGASNIAKNGLLGGLILPNLNYHVVNFLTGPFIISSTVGIRNMGVLGEGGLGEVMRHAYSLNIGAGKLTWKAPANRVLFTAPDGTVWTTEMLSKLVTDGSIGKSQSVAELTDSLVASTVDWAGKTGLYGDKNAAIKAMRRNFVNVYDMNMFTTAANAMDQTYRMGVIMKALKGEVDAKGVIKIAGEPLENALRLGREALFDYGSLNSVNEAIAKAIWFYRFKINNFASVFGSLATDPKALKLAFSSGQGFEYAYNFGEKSLGLDPRDVDLRYALKDYSENRIFLDLVEDPENKKRYGIYGPPIPQIQAVAEMTDYAAMFLTPYVLAARGEKGFGKATAETFIEAPAQIALENANPFVQGVGIAATGMDVRRGGQKASDYLDPKLIWYMQQNPEQWYTFTTMFNIEEVPLDEERPAVGYYNGRQWRIKKNDRTAAKNWQLWQTGLLAIGVGRTMRDYATIWANTGYAGEVVSSAAATATTLGAVPPRLPKPAPAGRTLPVTLDTDSAGVDFWRSVGVIQVQDAPLLEEVQKANRVKAAQEIRQKPVNTQQETQ